jgi:hypothetical protein
MSWSENSNRFFERIVGVNQAAGLVSIASKRSRYGHVGRSLPRHLAWEITSVRRSKVNDLNFWSTIAFESSDNLSRELLIISLGNASPSPPTRVPLLIGKGAIDDDVFDADVRRGGR